ncbi:ead/Ea22-like family protein [Klebsiella pneumoniae]|uniref:Uncharacterized protein n=3 Tax=Klebsiella pneumoniae TaxID=573 RepID=A0A2Z6H2N2_KLEPN|nr:hypothetical protein [Klebsiella pneumoniae]AIG85939.1 hypothetical protein Q770_03425 [Klebsiella pneumoniae subsp. pneumoniae PittNDM01]ALP79279.1 hypothetical protein AC565_17785 [Klebsiella pneumoniae]ART12380.1 hypothetical protein B8F96_18180 [Klebsiella pneumoniae]ARX42995.1 hypothetical protein AM390_03765 [Klebsiella pneumoniae]AVF14289.1 hypothetical protein AM445_25690 [Klebsiella pneumoniae]
MTDITELAQRNELLIANGQQTADLLRHLADNEIDSDYFAVVSECESYGKETDAELSITEFALRAAGYVDALVEALEKARRANGYLREQSAEWERKAISNFEDCAEMSARVEELESQRKLAFTASNRWADKFREAERRIAELESRTVTVKQGEVLVTVAGFTGCGKSAVAGEIEIAMKAIGVPVTWANDDSEKRMTGADWLTAIEMYKPTVRIVEENIPRAASIKVEAE